MLSQKPHCSFSLTDCNCILHERLQLICAVSDTLNDRNMSRRTYGLLIVFLSLGLIRPPSVIASRSMSIVTPPFTLSADESQELIASVSGFTDGEHVRIKGAIFREGSTNYFGFTENGGVWVKNSAPTDTQRSVDMSSWNGAMRIRADFNDSGFTGNGQYLVKIRFYYGENGSQWSENAVPVTLTAPTPTITLVPTPTMTPKPSEATPAPSVTPSETPTVRVVRMKSIVRPHALVASTSAILGIQEDRSIHASYEGHVAVDEAILETPNTLHVRILLGLGTIFGAVSAMLAYIRYGIWKKMHEQKHG